MAEKKEFDIAESFNKTEDFINQHQQPIYIILGVLAVLICGYYYYTGYYQPGKEKEAQAQVFTAQTYFEEDSLNLALNGDGNYIGLLSIIDDYSSTKAANLAHYYAGLSYLKMGDYQNAIEHLKKFSSDDLLVSTMALGAIGDAYMESGDTQNGIKYYKKAMENNPNELSTPVLMLKTAMTLEKRGDKSEAKKIYEEIRDQYPQSVEGRDIEKYIARVEAKE